MTPKKIESIVNDRDILKGSFYINELSVFKVSDFSENTIWMMTDHGGWAFIPRDLGVYECHFGYNRRGLRSFAFNHSEQCFFSMKILGAVKLVGLVAAENKLAKRFLEKLGCKKIARKDGPFKFAGLDTNLEVYEHGFCG